MSNELKPCPFCGGEAKLHHFGKTGALSVTIRCRTCKAQVQPLHHEPHFSYKARVEIVTRDWNRRVDEEVIGKHGCRWSDGTGNAPNGMYCGECDPSYESKCPHLVHDSSEWVECKNCTYFEECETKENRDGCYFGGTE